MRSTSAYQKAPGGERVWREPAGPPPADLKRSLDIIDRALVAKEKRFYRQSLKLFNEALDLDPYDHNLCIEKHEIEMKLERYPDALASAQRAVDLKPMHAKAYWMLGRAYGELGQYYEAVEAFVIGLEYHPTGKALMKGLADAKATLAPLSIAAQGDGEERVAKKEITDEMYKQVSERFASYMEWPEVKGGVECSPACEVVEMDQLLEGMPAELIMRIQNLKERPLPRGSTTDLQGDIGSTLASNKNSNSLLSAPRTIPHSAPAINLVTQLGLSQKQIVSLYETRAYRRQMQMIMNQAIDFFETLPQRKEAVIIFDVDDTALSNYEAMKHFAFEEIPNLVPGWVGTRSATAVHEVLIFYEYLVQKGFSIFFLSERKHEDYEDTLANLLSEGFTKIDRLIVKGKHQQHLTALAFKSRARQQLADEGLDIMGCVGDQQSDLCGGNTGFQIKLPNYLYEIA